MPQVYKDRILKFLKREEYQPLKLAQLARALGVDEDAYPAFQTAFDELRQAGHVVVGAGNVIMLPSIAGQVVGHFRRNPKGFGFVSPLEPNAHGDLFVPPDATGDAMTGDVVLAQALTNADGQAVAEFVNNFSDSITLRAEFRGDEQYAASNADTQIGAVNQGQVYVEHVGVDIPGFNVPPVLGASRAAVQSSRFEIGRFVQSLWPAMNGWPVAAVLIIVWSLYLLAVRFVLRVAALGSEAGESTSVESTGAM